MSTELVWFIVGMFFGIFISIGATYLEYLRWKRLMEEQERLEERATPQPATQEDPKPRKKTLTMWDE